VIADRLPGLDTLAVARYATTDRGVSRPSPISSTRRRPGSWTSSGVTCRVRDPSNVVTVQIEELMTKEEDMTVQVTAVMLGVQDLARAKAFYADGLGCKIDKDYPNFVELDLGEGSSSLALYEWGAAAQDAGVLAEGSGFRGVSLHFIVSSSEAVDEVIRNASDAGGEVVREAEASQWGGYFGYFSDSDGHLWKVATP
jgi:catechol 2,3-dioxygenase-like lactoylglutathione lyase family enzyme